MTLDDEIDELDEIFTLVLSNSSNATISDDTAMITILDDDTTEISVADVSEDE